jgi:hypothetical protein
MSTCNTPSPAPTARASSPSFTAPVSSLIASVTASGIANSSIGAAAPVVW